MSEQRCCVSVSSLKDATGSEGRGVTCVFFLVTCVLFSWVTCVVLIVREQQSRTRGPWVGPEIGNPRPSQVDASRLQSGFRPLVHVADTGYLKSTVSVCVSLVNADTNLKIKRAYP